MIGVLRLLTRANRRDTFVYAFNFNFRVKPTNRTESRQPLSNKTVIEISPATSSDYHLPNGTFLRTSSEKFSRNVTWAAPLSSAVASAIGNTAKRLPSGARAKFR